MNSEWPIVRLGDLVDSCLGKMLDAKKNKGVNQPYLGNSNVRWGNFHLTDLAEMRFEPKEEARYSLEPGDLVVCEGGEPGRCAIWTGEKGMKIQKALHRIRPKAALNNYYLFYWFLNSAKTGLLEPYFTGTTIKHLTGKAVAALELPLPPLSVQVATVEVLKPLDDRITLLRETNRTLESIAQAIFKSWFVDFDPVRAKMEGRQPEGMDEETAALFPDSLEEIKLALIPKGWGLSTVGESFILTMGQSPPGDTYNTSGEGLPFYQGRTDFGFRFPSERVFCTKPSRLAQTGDTLVSVRAPVGDVNMALDNCCIGRGVAAVRHPLNYNGFTFYAMKELGKEFHTYDSEGTVFGSISKKDFAALKVVQPNAAVLRLYDEITAPLDNRVVENERNIRTLTSLRDTLLPRLISGQLRLPEAQEQIESALS